MKLLPIQHTCRPRHHRHTSFGALAVLLALTAFVLGSVSWTAQADTTGAGGYTVYASVPSAPPKTVPHIEAPGAGQQFSQNPITIKGSCQAGTLVKLFKNEVLAGAVLCQQNNSFSLQVDLFFGSNTLIARDYNTLDAVSPDSAAVPVTFALPGVAAQPVASQYAPGSLPVNQLVLTSSVFHQGFFTEHQASWMTQITGGAAPYAVNVGWGDGKTDLISRPSAGPLTISHTYSSPGNGFGSSYNILINASDSNGSHAYLPLVAIVNVPGGTALIKKTTLGLQFAWPALFSAVALVGGFWIGELREKRVLATRPTTA